MSVEWLIPRSVLRSSVVRSPIRRANLVELFRRWRRNILCFEIPESCAVAIRIGWACTHIQRPHVPVVRGAVAQSEGHARARPVVNPAAIIIIDCVNTVLELGQRFGRFQLRLGLSVDQLPHPAG